jgi:hypothetical protein
VAGYGNSNLPIELDIFCAKLARKWCLLPMYLDGRFHEAFRDQNDWISHVDRHTSRSLRLKSNRSSSHVLKCFLDWFRSLRFLISRILGFVKIKHTSINFSKSLSKLAKSSFRFLFA